MTQNESTVKEAVEKLFVNPEQSKAVLAALVPSKRPAGWSRRSRATYYTEEYAMQVKRVLDNILQDKQDRLWRYEDWKQFSPTTVYLRINQSLRYLLDYMDADGRYKKLMSTLEIYRDRSAKGIRFGIKPEFANNPEGFVPEAVVPSVEMPKWKQRIEDWLETSEPGDKPFSLDKLCLTPDEVRDLKLEFAGLKNVIAHITASSIKLVKVRIQ